jgi:hypothetical protein
MPNFVTASKLIFEDITFALKWLIPLTMIGLAVIINLQEFAK